MIRKMSLFFATPVRKRLEEDVKFAATPAIRKAIRLPSEVVGATLPHWRAEALAVWAKQVGGEMWKYFHAGHCEHTQLEVAMSIAQRVEVIISFYQGNTTQLQVDMRFFRKGEKKCFFNNAFGVCVATAKVFTPACVTNECEWVWK